VGTRLAAGVLVGTVVVAVLAGGASSLGPPGSVSVSFGPLPKVGKAVYFKATVTGTVSGKPAPLFMVTTNPSVLTGNMVAAEAVSKPTVKGGKASATFVVVLYNSKKPLRKTSAVSQGNALDMIIEASGQAWGSPEVTKEEEPCKTAARIVHNMNVSGGNFWSRVSFAGMTWEDVFKQAEADC